MTAQSAKLVSLLMGLYFAGRPHGRNAQFPDGCECQNCEAWDAVEMIPQAVFDELEAELKTTEPKTI